MLLLIGSDIEESGGKQRWDKHLKGGELYLLHRGAGVLSPAQLLFLHNKSARLFMYLEPRSQWHYKHTLKTRNSLPFFVILFWYKMVQTTIQNSCAVDSLQKVLNLLTVQWLCFWFFFSMWVWYTPEFFENNHSHAGCNTFFIMILS